MDAVRTVLEAQSLYRFFHAGDDETLALRGVSISARAGEIVAVTGPSGSGKSTLLACLAGLDDPDGGVVRIDGERLSRRPEHERARIRARSVGILYQSENLVGHLNVAENVRLARGIAGRDRPRADDVLARVGIGHRAHSRPSELSGGELARAGLAVALANAPSLILADEPTGELDSANGARVLEVLRERAREGAAVVLVTHRTDAADFVDREVGLIDGRIR
jgi:putative ABC transport system ATP-binding protein